MTNKKIIIAGAGLSGLTAAIVLSKAGHEVEIFERNNDVGKRFNGDFQGLMNWGFDIDMIDYMENIGLTTDFWKKPLNQLDIFGPDNLLKHFTTNSPYTYLVERGLGKNAIDQNLKNQALENNVKINFNHSYKKDVEVEPDIIATGPKFDGVTDAMAMGYTFNTSAPNAAAVILDDNYAYDGYSYFFIANGKGTISTCIFGRYNNLKKYLDKTLIFIKKHYNFDIVNQKTFTGFGNFYLLNSSKKYVGEAGGFQDFLWGFGMRYAIITGASAAKSIIEKKDYRKIWQKEIGGLLKASIVNRFWFALLGKNSYKYFIKLWKRTSDPLAILSRVYKFNIFSRIIYPFAKLYFNKHIKDRNST